MFGGVEIVKIFTDHIVRVSFFSYETQCIASLLFVLVRRCVMRFYFFCFYETQYIASLLLEVLAIEFVKIFCDGGHGVPCSYFGRVVLLF